MSLKDKVRDYLDVVRRAPGSAVDPKTLAELERATIEDPDGMYGALSIPVAKRTWMQGTLFLGSVAQSNRVILKVPFPVWIVGCEPLLEVVTGNLLNPTLSSIQVQFDLNLNEYQTAAQGTTTTVGGTDGNFVSLGAMGATLGTGARLLLWKLPNTVTEIGMVFRWARGAGVYNDTLVQMNFFVEPIGDRRY